MLSKLKLQTYFSQVLQAKKKVILITFITFALGILYAFTSPSEWTSSVKFLPDSNEGAQIGGKLGDIASIAGISGLGVGDDGNRLSPDMYMDIVNSTPYYRKLFDQQLLYSSGSTIDIKSYYEEIHSPTIGQRVTIGLSNLIDAAKGIFKSTDSESGGGYPYEFFTIEETELVKELKDRIELHVNRKTGIISVRSHFQDRVFAASVSTFTKEYLEDYLNDFANKKERLNLEFIEEQLGEAKLKFKKSQDALADFSDQNISLANERSQIRKEELRLERDFDFNIYQNLATQRQSAELEVEQSTAILSIIQPVTIPALRDSPKRVRIIILSIFLGFFFSVAWILRKEVLKIIGEIFSNKGVENQISS